MNIDFRSRHNLVLFAVGGVLIVVVLVAFWARYLRYTDLYVGFFNSNAATPPLTCHLSAQAPAGATTRIRVLFQNGIKNPDTVWMSSKSSANRRAQETVAKTIPAGTYKVTLESWDAHSQNGGGGQTREQYKLELKDSANKVLTTTGASADIPDNADYKKSLLSQSVIVQAGTSKITPVHAAYVDNSSHNSLTAVCATFDLVSSPQATLTVIKHVVNDNVPDPRTDTAGSFQIHVKSGGVDVANSPAGGSETGTTYTLAAGTYTVNEDFHDNYTMTGITGDCAANGDITLVAGQTKTCTITNNDNEPPPPDHATLTVIKALTNNNGRTAQESEFMIHVKKSGAEVTDSPQGGSSSGVVYTLVPGTYVVSEDSFPDYTMTGMSADCAADGTVTLIANDAKTCIVANDDNPMPPATLTVIKTVVNTGGGTATADQFQITVTGGNPSPANFSGAESGTTVTLEAGSYSVDEDADSNYTKTISDDCTGTIAAGESKTCTITNTYSALPPPSDVVISALPVCSASGYSATITWAGDPNPTTGNFLVEISDDPNFSSPFSKTVQSSPTDSSGFMRGTETLELLPGTTYYARVSNF